MPKHTLAPAALLALGFVSAPACAGSTGHPSSATSAVTTSPPAPPLPLLDRSAQSFARWRHVGGGEFVRNTDGSVETRGGPLGMLWYPDLPMRDVVVRLQWRDVAPRCCSNSGVFIRFPDPEAATRAPTPPFPCQRGLAATRPEWTAIFCGQEIQINDGGSDPQPTGSVYGFKLANKPSAAGRVRGAWNDLAIEITGNGDYAVTVTENGRVINTFRNSPGQASMRAGDPPTDDRQFAAGYLGLQNHAGGDAVQFRDITATLLGPA